MLLLLFVAVSFLASHCHVYPCLSSLHLYLTRRAGQVSRAHKRVHCSTVQDPTDYEEGENSCSQLYFWFTHVLTDAYPLTSSCTDVIRHGRAESRGPRLCGCRQAIRPHGQVLQRRTTLSCCHSLISVYSRADALQIAGLVPGKSLRLGKGEEISSHYKDGQVRVRSASLLLACADCCTGAQGPRDEQAGQCWQPPPQPQDRRREQSHPQRAPGADCVIPCY